METSKLPFHPDPRHNKRTVIMYRTNEGVRVFCCTFNALEFDEPGNQIRCEQHAFFDRPGLAVTGQVNLSEKISKTRNLRHGAKLHKPLHMLYSEN